MTVERSSCCHHLLAVTSTEMPDHAQRLRAPVGEPVVFGTDGFIVAPGSWPPAQNPEVTTIDSIADLRAVVVLGEPGIGKSTVLRGLYDHARSTNPRAVWIDLGGFGSEQLLSDHVFAHAVWSTDADECDVEVYLDALDEARLRIPVIARLLTRGLAAVDTGRLRLRFGCRVGQWPSSLTDGLTSLWPQDPPALQRLLPLTRQEIVAAASRAGVDGAAFVSEVVRVGIAPLAGHPMTLNLLLAEVAAGRGLPETQIEAYERGLRLLCEEPDEERRDDPTTSGRLSASGRFAIARRIAAATILSGHNAVWNGIDDGSVPPNAVLVDNLLGGQEFDTFGAVPTSIHVRNGEIGETLHTGLFSAGADPRDVRFVHQSFGEFLAANWLSDLDFERIASLLCLAGDPDRRIVPQLQGVAAWLAAMRDDVFEHVTSVDAQLLLRHGLAQQPDDRRASILEVLLGLVRLGRVDDYDSSVRTALIDLAHPGLGEQICGVLANKERPDTVRRFACLIAEQCRLSSTVPTLVEIALDDAAPVRLRTRALLAIDAIPADTSQRARLVELTVAEIDDPDADELKGAALMATWPYVLSAEQVFDALTDPRESGVIGLYFSFLTSNLLDDLTDDDVPAALGWAARLYDPYDVEHLSLVALQILVRASALLEDGGIADAVTEIVAKLLAQHTVLLQHSIVDTGGLFVDPAGRQEIVRRLVGRVARDELDPSHGVLSVPPLLIGEDLGWLLGQLEQTVGTTDERGWALLVAALWAGDDDATATRIWDAKQISDELASVVAHRFEAVAIDSEQANEARKWQEHSRRVAARRLEQKSDQEKYADSLPERLAAALADPGTTWPQLSALLTGQPGETGLREAEHRTVDSPGFQIADAAQQSHLIASAEQFLTTADVGTDAWLETTRVPSTAIAGVRALDLLLSEALGSLDAFPPTVWERWAAALVAHPAGHESKGEAVRELRTRLNAIHPELAADAMIRLIAAENRQRGQAWQLEHADELRSAELSARLVGVLEAGGLQPKAIADIVGFGLRDHDIAIRDWALDVVSTAHTRSWAQQEWPASIQAGAKLIAYTVDAAWNGIWPAIEASRLWGRDLVAALFAAGEPRLLGDALTITELRALFEWLEEQYPIAEDPPSTLIDGFRSQVARWRDSLLTSLADRGTDGAVGSLEELQAAYPAYQGIGHLLVRADDARRRASWQPAQPGAVIRLAADNRSRLVTSDLDLQRVVLEALENVQRRLRPPHPAAADLWDTRGAGWEPKAEDDVSDWLIRQLKDEFGNRLLLVDREVQVSRTPGGGVGERTDVLVRSVAGTNLDNAAIVTTVIEVKGCWNKDLKTEMRHQLAERYLNPLTQRCGIYLIAWFDRTVWTTNDYRRGRCAASMESMRTTYEQQALELSSDGHLVIHAVVLDCSLPSSD
jgi:hypothetical protein